MNGSRLLIDTNIALYLLGGDGRVAELLDGQDIYLSFISELELLGFRDLDAKEEAIVLDFISKCTVVNIDQHIKQQTIAIRRASQVKLPDAIIAATSIHLELPLLSADKGFSRINQLAFIQYEI